MGLGVPSARAPFDSVGYKEPSGRKLRGSAADPCQVSHRAAARKVSSHSQGRGPEGSLPYRHTQALGEGWSQEKAPAPNSSPKGARGGTESWPAACAEGKQRCSFLRLLRPAPGEPGKEGAPQAPSLTSPAHVPPAGRPVLMRRFSAFPKTNARRVGLTSCEWESPPPRPRPPPVPLGPAGQEPRPARPPLAPEPPAGPPACPHSSGRG